MQILKKTIKILSDSLDICLLIVCLLLVLLGIYSFIDNTYLYNAATDKSILYYKPELNEPITEDRLITENQVGWIHIEGTKVDFPVLQGKDNVEYLNKDPYGEFSFSGSIFLDSRNSADFSDSYSVIYGHHMSGGHMFGCLDSFLNEAFLKEHRNGILTTTDIVYDLELFAVLSCQATDPYIFAPGEKSIDSVITYIKTHSIYLKDSVIGDKIIALTTCTDEGDDSRLAVICSLRTLNTDEALESVFILILAELISEIALTALTTSRSSLYALRYQSSRPSRSHRVWRNRSGRRIRKTLKA